MGKVAVVLSGCGNLDGSEIHESVMCLYHLAKKGHQVHCFAPNIVSHHIMNHLTKQKDKGASREVLVESARIARGHIQDLEELKPEKFDAIVLPGGLGAALNLSDFAEKEEHCTVNETLKKILLKFYSLKKPIGATCIAPVILAKAFQDVASLKITLGSDLKYQSMLHRLGMKGVLAKVHESVSDEEHLIFTTPCYMEPEDLVGLSDGIESMIDNLSQAMR